MITNGAPKWKQTAWACCESTTCGQSTSGTPQRSTVASCSCLCFRNTWYTTEHHQSRSSKKRLLGTSPRSLTSCRETSLPGLCPEPVDHEVFVDGYVHKYIYIYTVCQIWRKRLCKHAQLVHYLWVIFCCISNHFVNSNHLKISNL